MGRTTPIMKSFLVPIFVFLIYESRAAAIPRNGKCQPGELIWVDCNLCTCNVQGVPNPVCAKMWCQPQPKPKTPPPDFFEENNSNDVSANSDK